jgi:hypothetical protein
MAQIVVGITSLPSRIGLIRPTIESLQTGEIKPDRIILALPMRSVREDREYDIPAWLEDIGVEVVRTQVDFGPGTKLLGVLPHLVQDTYLVVADDDVSYRADFLAKIVKAQSSDHSCSFSFYAYRAFGLEVGQGCDGFSFWTPNLAGIEEFASIHILGTPLRLHDDLWISVFLATKAIRIKGLMHQLGSGLIYGQVHEVNALHRLDGSNSREELTRRGVRALKSVLPLRARVPVEIALSLDFIKRRIKVISALLLYDKLK